MSELRTEFERLHPVPDGSIWSDENNRYEWVAHSYDCVAHNTLWQGFQSGHAAGLERAEAWQPIKTAPKDGTMILAVLPDSDSFYVIEWADADKGIRKEAGKGIGWHHSWDGYFFLPHEQPTHWRSLPDADTIRAMKEPK